MPKNDNAHAIRLAEAIQAVKGAEAAQAFADAHPLSKSADVNKKFTWACDICRDLESQFTSEQAAAIRRACCCGDGKTMAQEISSCFSKTGSIAEGCKLFSQKNKYAFLEYCNERELIFGYRVCVCSCVKRSEQPIPQLWCECSVGYAQSMFRIVFGDRVDVRLLDSVKSGGSCCKMRITWQ